MCVLNQATMTLGERHTRKRAVWAKQERGRIIRSEFLVF